MASTRRPDADTDTDGRRRVVIEGVDPEIDGGRFPAKAVAGDPFVVEADVFADGHDILRCLLLHRTARQRAWREAEMRLLGNDRWRGAFEPKEPGRCLYTLEAWVDRYGTWLRDLKKRVEAGQDVAVDLLIGADRVEEARKVAGGRDAGRLGGAVDRLHRLAEHQEAGGDADLDGLLSELEGPVRKLVRRNDPRRFAVRHERELEVVVDRERATYGAWYEFFPRSTGPDGEHGSFRTAADFLPYVADMGFDVVYLPPVHPIGRTNRKGRNNGPRAEPGDVGSPWAIGAPEGGHTAVHPDLGTLEDFRDFRERAEALGLEVALDVAFQASPDHPWVRQHPEWFTRRPDGTIQYAENPPKKYEDIYPIDFQSPDWRNLWRALEGVFDFWIGQGVKIFRVDNPHTKSLRFWAWCIPEIRRRNPDVIFLSEAFTRPKVMYRLAKLGFTQSYTYFAWRNHAWELRTYMEELTRSPVRHLFRPSFWPNTPDILTETLQHGGRSAFMMRLVLAATLTANYGIYGPAFELLEHVPRESGGEEYLGSEKYQLRDWDLGRPDSLRDFIARMNRIRRQNPALQRNENLSFHPVDNDLLLAYAKRSRDGGNTILTVANLDPHHRQSGWIELDLEALGLVHGESYQVDDLLGGGRYGWHDRRNYVELDPHVCPAHVFRLVRH
ncbi:MAG TPA: alpha-1,4-glucan--maltose-1-phosphate maltosyltransferase, partial [Longimicrobiales bacterium]|nr:alpha-1,4-glucan--maltose-1-phosphate maltosyltransferase [Longimicrobiales bacterium]